MADGVRVAADFVGLLGAGVARRAERLQLSVPEKPGVAFMLYHVIGDRRRSSLPAIGAHAASRVASELRFSADLPASRFIELAVFRGFF